MILALVPVKAIGQSVERQVLGTTGGSSNTSNVSVSYTAGELVTETYNTSTIILSQGFQQTETSTLSIQMPELGFSLKAYPNPTSEMVILEFSTDNYLEISVCLTDMLGKSVGKAEDLNLTGIGTHVIDMSMLDAGIYYLQLLNIEGVAIKTIKVQKKD
ncbi:MAG: T9SS type A sorting domain-containing protein [Flavobacteriales bacterium]|nr:T9SS type A sorting domain-containing protein [Flavobacteriales bacterium]